MATIEERLAMLEGQHNRLADEVRTNNVMTAEMYGVFREMQPGFKFLTDLHSLMSRMGKVVYCFLGRLAKASKVIVPVVVLTYVIYSWLSKGTIPISL